MEGTKDTSLRFLKLPNTRYAPSKDEDAMDEDQQQSSRNYLRAIQDLNGYGAVWMAGSPSTFILKNADCPPQILPLAGGEIKSLTPFHTHDCKHGFAYISEDVSSTQAYGITHSLRFLLVHHYSYRRSSIFYNLPDRRLYNPHSSWGNLLRSDLSRSSRCLRPRSRPPHSIHTPRP